MHSFNVCGEGVLSNRIYLIILDIFYFFFFIFFFERFSASEKGVYFNKPNSGCRALYFLELGAEPNFFFFFFFVYQHEIVVGGGGTLGEIKCEGRWLLT